MNGLKFFLLLLKDFRMETSRWLGEVFRCIGGPIKATMLGVFFKKSR